MGAKPGGSSGPVCVSGSAPMEGGARLTRDHVRPAQELGCLEVRRRPPDRLEEFTDVGVSSHRLGPAVIAVLDVLGHERQHSVHLMGVPCVLPARHKIVVSPLSSTSIVVSAGVVMSSAAVVESVSDMGLSSLSPVMPSLPLSLARRRRLLHPLTPSHPPGDGWVTTAALPWRRVGDHRVEHPPVAADHTAASTICPWYGFGAPSSAARPSA